MKRTILVLIAVGAVFAAQADTNETESQGNGGGWIPPYIASILGNGGGWEPPKQNDRLSINHR